MFAGATRISWISPKAGRCILPMESGSSGRFFSTLGLHAAVGRLISDSDDRRGCPAVAVLSYGFWQDHFGGTMGAIGSTLSIRSRPFEVIGIARAAFFVWKWVKSSTWRCPSALQRSLREKSPTGHRNFFVAERRRSHHPNMTRAQLTSRLRILVAQDLHTTGRLPEERQYLSKIALTAIPAASGISSLRKQFSQPLQILMIVVGLVLLIACATSGA